MSELSERVAREHFWTLTEHIDRHGDDYFTGGCVCGAAQDADTDDESYDGGHAAHLAEVTEATVRETIAADITNAVLPTHPNTGYRDGITRAARIARGES